MHVQGLWGPGSAFRDFKTFWDSTNKRGIPFLEMLAMELKSEGVFVARTLSFTCGCPRTSCSLCMQSPCWGDTGFAAIVTAHASP